MNFDGHSQPESTGHVSSSHRTHALFVCGPGRMRSLTAEQVFVTRGDLRVAAAGVDSRGDHAVTAELLRWADVVFVMEDVQRKKLLERFGEAMHGKPVVELGIPDRYEYMDPQLIQLLRANTAKYLG